jgi:rhodanese-related sulfurtransferase
MKTITTQELKNKIATDIGLHVWNVTGTEWFKGEVIPGSRYIPAEKLAEAVKNASLPKDAAIVVYCAGPQCPASKNAAEQLTELGFTNVTKYAGGIAEWKQAGYDVSREAVDECCGGGSCGTEVKVEKKHAGGCC